MTKYKKRRITILLFLYLIWKATTDYVGGAEKALVMSREKPPFDVN